MSFSQVRDLLQEAIALHRRGAIAEASARCGEVLGIDPNNLDAYYCLGMMACQEGRFAEGAELAGRALIERGAKAHILRGRALSALGWHDEAMESLQQAAALAPDLAPAHSHLADLLSDVGRKAEAIDSYDRAVALAPDNFEDWFNRGLALCDVGRREEALVSFERAIVEKPEFVQAHLQRGNVLWQLQRNGEALESVDRALEIQSNLAEAWHSRGNILNALRRDGEALAAYDTALGLKPDLAEAWLGRANVLSGFKRYPEALAAYGKALTYNVNLTEAWLGRGNALAKSKEYGDALAAYDKALAIKPNLAPAWHGRGSALLELKSHHEALAAFDRVLVLDPDLGEVWVGLGNAFQELGRHDKAFEAFDRALALNPELAEAWLGRGNLLQQLKQPDALPAYGRALALKPGLAEAWLGRANIFLDLRRYEDAFKAYDEALALEPNLKFARGGRLYAQLHLNDWKDLDAEISAVTSAVRDQKLVITPFSFLPISSSPSEQLACANCFVRNQPTFPSMWSGEIFSHERIRIGYLSADFHNHPVAELAVGLFEHHDKSRFQTIGISFGPDDRSELRGRIKSAFDNFIDVQHMGDDDVARLIRDHEIDIAIDLMAFTQGNRLNVLARRAAPIQVNYLGYPGSMGAHYIDYIIADPTIIPADHFPFYSEQVVWLPDCYQANDANRYSPRTRPLRSECGLPEWAFVFCCFNNTYKIVPEIFDLWTRLLKAVPNSILWLLETSQAAMWERYQRGEAPKTFAVERIG